MLDLVRGWSCQHPLRILATVSSHLRMFIITAKESDTVENLLRKYKSKYKQLGVMKAVRKRAYYQKPSIKRRKEVLKAISKERYLQALR